MKARKKPVEIDYEYFVPGMDLTPEFKVIVCQCKARALPHIHTLEGEHDLTWGDVIIKGVKGEFYPCKPDIFKMTYKLEEGTVVNKKELGIYEKFHVRRTDGNDQPGMKHDGCDYFVLDITHDPFAIPAILAYANACESEYPTLAVDLRKKGLPQ